MDPAAIQIPTLQEENIKKTGEMMKEQILLNSQDFSVK